MNWDTLNIDRANYRADIYALDLLWAWYDRVNDMSPADYERASEWYSGTQGSSA
jgi:hypothetical protein